MYFTFCAADNVKPLHWRSLDNFVDKFPDAQTVWLDTAEEFELLLSMLEIKLSLLEADTPAFVRVYDISGQAFPNFTEEEFEVFYRQWLQRSGRQSSMDEYGQLVFLVGKTKAWNESTHRLIVIE